MLKLDPQLAAIAPAGAKPSAKLMVPEKVAIFIFHHSLAVSCCSNIHSTTLLDFCWVLVATRIVAWKRYDPGDQLVA